MNAKHNTTKNYIYYAIVTAALLATMLFAATFFIHAAEPNVKEVTFDLSKGNVAITDEGYIGVGSDNIVRNSEYEEGYVYRFVIMQSDYETQSTQYVISVGTPTKGVTKDYEIHLKSLNIDPQGNVGTMFEVTEQNVTQKQPHAPSIYVNNELGSTVYLVLDDDTQSTMKGYAHVFSGDNPNKSDKRYKLVDATAANRYGHAAIEKEVGLEVSSQAEYTQNDAQGTLVLTCEQGFANYKNNTDLL